jgi:hypothetical protein
LTSVAKAASPSTRSCGRSPTTNFTNASAGLAASIATRRSGGTSADDSIHSTRPGGVMRRRSAKAPQQRWPAFELDPQGSRGVHPQPFHRLRLGGNHVVEEKHDPLHHRPFGERLHGLEHASIVGGAPSALRGERA